MVYEFLIFLIFFFKWLWEFSVNLKHTYQQPSKRNTSYALKLERQILRANEVSNAILLYNAIIRWHKTSFFSNDP